MCLKQVREPACNNLRAGDGPRAAVEYPCCRPLLLLDLFYYFKCFHLDLRDCFFLVSAINKNFYKNWQCLKMPRHGGWTHPWGYFNFFNVAVKHVVKNPIF